jgi:hypothetical protein
MSSSNSKFVLVPFFSVLEKDVQINLRLSAFEKMFPYILYCPNIAQCTWLQPMIPTNITNCNFLMHKIPSNVECLVLLHSPITIDVEKLGTIKEEVYDDKMNNDITTQEMNKFSPALSLSLDAFLRRNKLHSLGYMKLSSMDCTTNLVD